ncbi:MAG TPA: glycoside hydrolase family 97 protein [Pirellulales bacterium]
MYRYIASIALLLLHIANVVFANDRQPAASVVVASPDEQVAIEVFLEDAGNDRSRAGYRVSFHDKVAVLPSRLGVELADGTTLGGDCAVEKVERRSFDETYNQFPGKRSRVRDHGVEAVISFRENTMPKRRWQFVARAYDDGVAFRYRFVKQKDDEKLELAAERTEFQLPGDPTTFAMMLPSFTTPHEEHYRRLRLSQLAADKLIGLPVLMELASVGWAAILEADLTDYAALYLTRAGDQRASLAAKLAPRPRQAKLAVRADLPHESPWRVMMIAADPRRFIESDLVLNLNKPNAIGDTSWIKPGKTTFPWWNGFYEENVPFRMGLNTDTAKYYIDSCAAAGIEFHSLDGLDNVAWYGGPIVPYQGADIVQGVAGLDLEEVIRHANSKGVRLRLWMNWKAAERHMDRAFPLYRRWGIQGVMVDFLDRDDQDISRFIHRLLKTAADNRLTVTIHNTKEPTGLERTYPNLLTTEGVRNLEFDKWDAAGISPTDDLMVPYTRMLAGPLDYHQGTLRGVPVAKFQARNAAPLVIGTPCHALASYVVYQNHLPMLADYPSAYRGHPALPFLVKCPVSWDDTRCLAGEPGEYVVVARRSGSNWYLGAMNGAQARELDLPLRFLAASRYRAEIFADDLEGTSPFRLVERVQEVTSADSLRIQLDAAGGYAAKLTLSLGDEPDRIRGIPIQE